MSEYTQYFQESQPMFIESDLEVQVSTPKKDKAIKNKKVKKKRREKSFKDVEVPPAPKKIKVIIHKNKS